MKKLSICVCVLLLLACTGMTFLQKGSRVEQFWYGGYDDTSCAILIGKMYYLESGKKIPLEGVVITVNENNKFIHSDAAGGFQVGLEKGTFSFTVSKDGYEPLHLDNFVSDPDQVSHIQIILEKGFMKRIYELPPHNKQQLRPQP